MKDSSNFKGKETRFELSVSRPKNTIYLSIIGMPKKSHFTIFAIQNFLQNTKKHTWIPFILLRNEWCLFDCFHHEFTVSTQLMVRDYCIAKCKKFSACGGVLMAPRVIFPRFRIFTLIWTLGICSQYFHFDSVIENIGIL